MSSLDVAACRAQFPALARTLQDKPVIYFDGPAGSQVPRSVAEAMRHYLLHTNANHGGNFLTSQESDGMVVRAQQAAAAFFGTDDPETVIFGANMTTLTFALSRALAKTWKAGEEIIVTRLDHDANVTPWALAAQEAGVTVRTVGIHREDCTLDLEDLQRQLSSRTRLVAVGAASNVAGTVNPVRQIADMAHAVGSQVYVDAVHAAPHLLPEVQAWGCDYAVCSAYKFFGPHVGMLWGRREHLERLPAYKVRPAGNDIPWRWMTGTPNLEGIAGTGAALEYLATLSGAREIDRPHLQEAYRRIYQHEQTLAARMLAGLRQMPDITIRGIANPERLHQRVPTFSFTHRRLASPVIAQRLAEQGIFGWHGNLYALSLSETLGLEPEGMVRLGMLHYATLEEVERCLKALGEM
jgi:cysteine desulfurase family protein (TIGR01976 family)